MYGNPWDFSSCLAVEPTLADRCEAVQELVRPREVRRLARAIWRKWGNDYYAPACVSNFVELALREGSLRYCPDPPFDTWCTPQGTINRGCGDCDDFAILVLSLLLALRVRAHAVIGHVVKPDGSFEGHMWVEGWYADGDPFMFEATTGEIFGDRPWNYVAVQFASPTFCGIA